MNGIRGAGRAQSGGVHTLATGPDRAARAKATGATDRVAGGRVFDAGGAMVGTAHAGHPSPWHGGGPSQASMQQGLTKDPLAAKAWKANMPLANNTKTSR